MRQEGGTRLRLLALGLVVALATLGVGYAAWTQQLTFNGTVETGTVGVNWLDTATCADTDPLGAGITTGERDSTDHKLVHMVIDNGYPGYEGRCFFEHENSGSLPLQIVSLEIQGTTVGPGTWNDFDLTGNGLNDVSIRVTNGISATYQPGQQGDIGVRVLVLDDAPMNETLVFSGHVNFELQSSP